MKIRALGILEPRGFDKRVHPGEEVEVPDEEGARFCQMGAAEPVATKPSQRAEKRPRGDSETR